MTKYIVAETSEPSKHAGSKPRTDIVEILRTQGWSLIKVKPKWEKANPLKRACAIPSVVADWLKISITVIRGDILVFPYPLSIYPKVSQIVLPFLLMIKKRGIKIIAFIHDLSALRESQTNKTEDAFLSTADVLIAHNNAMAKYLSKHYNQKIVTLGIFDYLLPNSVQTSKDPIGIDIAGNLSPKKAGYIYHLSNDFPNTIFNFYGPEFDTSSEEAKSYKGSFLPNDLISHLNGKFGLVWDGESTTTCSGKFGTYLKFNDPYKLSLYLSLGKPVIIWDQAAAGDIVRQASCGIVADSIETAVAKIEQMSDSDYSLMCNSAKLIGERLRTGFYTKAAIAKATELL